MEAYKNWVRRNKDYVHSLESMASGLTWLLPERFSSSEIVPEAVSSALGIITALNQHIIDTAPRQWSAGPSQPYLFPYSLCISAFKEIEILVEVIAEQLYGEDKKWDFITAMEAIKVLLRLAVFRDSGYKMLLQGGELPNSGHGNDASGAQHKIHTFLHSSGTQNPGDIGTQPVQNPWNLEGKALSALSRFGENARMAYTSTWSNRMQHQAATAGPPAQAVRRPTIASILAEKGLNGTLFLTGEVLFMLRPLIYVIFIKKYGRHSWTPWIVSLVVDLVGMCATLQGTRIQRETMKQNRLSDEEKDEVRRRKILWAFYVMRDPFFCKYTRRRLESTQKTLEPVPIVGLITDKVFELIFGAQSRYTYISGS